MVDSIADVINHLIEHEQQAEGLLQEARTEADQRIAKARSDAEADYKVRYEQIIDNLEAVYKVRYAEIEKTSQEKSAEYRGSLEDPMWGIGRRVLGKEQRPQFVQGIGLKKPRRPMPHIGFSQHFACFGIHIGSRGASIHHRLSAPAVCPDMC